MVLCDSLKVFAKLAEAIASATCRTSARVMFGLCNRGQFKDRKITIAWASVPSLKVLFTSGYAEPAVARMGLEAGAWLKKPYTADELAEKVREVLREPRG